MGDSETQTDGHGGLNGQTGALVRWVVGVLVAGLVSYFTAQGTINERVAVVETSEQNHFEEVQRSLSRIEKRLDGWELRGSAGAAPASVAPPGNGPGPWSDQWRSMYPPASRR